MDTVAPARRAGRRPNVSLGFEREVVEATFQPGASVSLIARERDVNANLVYRWPGDLQALNALVSAQRAEIQRLKMMIAKLRRTQFGRNSEQLDAMIDQLRLGLEELLVSRAEMTPSVEPAPRAVSRRKPMPEHRPRETHVHQPESKCTGCGGKLRYLGEDVSEVLEYVPACFKVIRHRL